MEIGSRGYELNGITRDEEKSFNPELKGCITQKTSEVSVCETVTAASLSTVVVEAEMRNESISIPGTAGVTVEEHAIQVTSGTFTSNTVSAGLDSFENVAPQPNASGNNNVPEDPAKEELQLNDQVIVEENVAEVVSMETNENNPKAAVATETFVEVNSSLEAAGCRSHEEQNQSDKKDENISKVTVEATTDQSPEGTDNAATLQVPETSDELPSKQEKTDELATDVLTMENQPEGLDHPDKTDVVAVDQASKSAKEVTTDKEQTLVNAQHEAVVDAIKEPVPEVVNAAGDIPIPDVPQDEAAVKVADISEEEIESLKGQKVKKKFGKKFYFGDVISYDPEAKWFKVVYEDGDEEDLEVDEVKQILVSEEKTPESLSKKRSRADGNETSKKSKKPTVTSTAKKPAAKTSIKSPKTPATKSKDTTKKAKSVAKSSKKNLASPKTPGESEETVTKKTASKAVSSKKAGGNKVSRSLDLQTPVTQGKEKAKTAGEKSTVKKNLKAPKVEKSVSKRKPDEEGASDLKAKRPKKEEAHADEAVSLIGKHVKKDFGGTLYGGQVVKYDKKTQYFKVVYEDGDEEELERHELDPILVDETTDVVKGTSSVPETESVKL